MDIAIIGLGYVGLVTAACLAKFGHRVVGVDINRKRIKDLKRGILPFYEEGLAKLIKSGLKKKRLSFTHLYKKAIPQSELIFLAVGTPPRKNGSADLSQVKEAMKEIVKYLEDKQIIVNKCTVPVGTARWLNKFIVQKKKGHFAIVSCPEFLREGSAVKDFLSPDRIVVGGEDKKAVKKVLRLFKEIKCPKLAVSWKTAELIKYAANAFLATKISFINEMAYVCEQTGANVEEVARGMGLDRRIGPSFLKAGLGYGGSCFPKDIHALHHIALRNNYNFKLLKAVIEVNNQQRLLPVKKLKKLLGSLKNKEIAVLGLAFKNNTDDIRESASLAIIKLLQKEGARVKAYDPLAIDNAKRVLPEVHYFKNPYQAVEEGEAVIIATEWPEFVNLNWSRIKRLLKRPVVMDGRNLLNPSLMKKLGFNYQSIGRK